MFTSRRRNVNTGLVRDWLDSNERRENGPSSRLGPSESDCYRRGRPRPGGFGFRPRSYGGRQRFRDTISPLSVPHQVHDSIRRSVSDVTNRPMRSNLFDGQMSGGLFSRARTNPFDSVTSRFDTESRLYCQSSDSSLAPSTSMDTNSTAVKTSRRLLRDVKLCPLAKGKEQEQLGKKHQVKKEQSCNPDPCTKPSKRGGLRTGMTILGTCCLV